MAVNVDDAAIAGIRSAALPVLIHRLGGEVTFTKAEFDEVIALYGGISKVSVLLTELEGPGITTRTFRLTIVKREQENGALPV